jgi:hypothetical protein
MSDTPDTETKAPARPAAEILAEIERERAGLVSAFDSLRGELDEALDAGRERVRQAGKKAAKVGPVVAGVVVSAAAAALLLRRRSAKKE